MFEKVGKPCWLIQHLRLQLTFNDFEKMLIDLITSTVFYVLDEYLSNKFNYAINIDRAS